MKGFNFPPPTGPYKLSLNSKAPWRSFDRVRVQVSLHNPRYEGAKWQAINEWCCHRFKHVDIILSDTLQRHNGADAKKARQEGDAWLLRNPVKGNLIRWDELLADPSYKPAATKVQNAYRDDKAFRARLNSKARNHQSGPEFLLEELAVFSFLFERPAIDLYAGSWIRDLFKPLGLQGNVLSVDLERNRAWPRLVA